MKLNTIFLIAFLFISKTSYADSRYFGELRYITPIFSTGDNQDNRAPADAYFPSNSKINTDENKEFGLAFGIDFLNHHSLLLSFEQKNTGWEQKNFASPSGTNYDYINRDIDIKNLLLEYNYSYYFYDRFKISAIFGIGLSHLENRDLVNYSVSPGVFVGSTTDTPGHGVYDLSNKFGIGIENKLTETSSINLSWVRVDYGTAESNKGSIRPTLETEIIEEQIILGLKKYF